MIEVSWFGGMKSPLNKPQLMHSHPHSQHHSYFWESKSSIHVKDSFQWMKIGIKRSLPFLVLYFCCYKWLAHRPTIFKELSPLANILVEILLAFFCFFLGQKTDRQHIFMLIMNVERDYKLEIYKKKIRLIGHWKGWLKDKRSFIFTYSFNTLWSNN